MVRRMAGTFEGEELDLLSEEAPSEEDSFVDESISEEHLEELYQTALQRDPENVEKVFASLLAQQQADFYGNE
jgi:hypothetical protein